MRFDKIQTHILAVSWQIQSGLPLRYVGHHAFNVHPNERRSHPPYRQGTNMYMSTHHSPRKRIAVIGGGASGMFAATAAADYVRSHDTEGCDVVIFEGTSKTMQKVRISGGGRCNVMHDRTKSLPQILSSYPRGNKELRGMFTKRFTPNDAYSWFTSRGVQLKTESDGRMFPVTDNSQTIIDAISDAATKVGVCLRLNEKVEKVKLIEDESAGFSLQLSSKLQSNERVQNEEIFDSIILATGSFPIGHEIARSLGHTIVKPVPSLFTFDSKELVKDGGLFNGLSGLSVPLARITLKVTDDAISSDQSQDSTIKQSGQQSSKKKRRGKKSKSIVQEGPLLITHHGISGPATLRLSAFAAREFNALKYKCDVEIHFCPKWEEEKRLDGLKGSSGDIVLDELWKMTQMIPKRKISTGCPLFMKTPMTDEDAPIIPKRLWQALVQHSSIPRDLTWADASKTAIKTLSTSISSFTLPVTGRGTFKEEFVTAGGIDLKEVQMTNMESKCAPGLFMCGEVLDVDGVTGGFNFMGCWSTGFVAGEGAAEFCVEKKLELS